MQLLPPTHLTLTKNTDQAVYNQVTQNYWVLGYTVWYHASLCQGARRQSDRDRNINNKPKHRPNIKQTLNKQKTRKKHPGKNTPKKTHWYPTTKQRGGGGQKIPKKRDTTKEQNKCTTITFTFGKNNWERQREMESKHFCALPHSANYPHGSQKTIIIVLVDQSDELTRENGNPDRHSGGDQGVEQE